MNTGRGNTCKDPETKLMGSESAGMIDAQQAGRELQEVRVELLERGAIRAL